MSDQQILEALKFWQILREVYDLEIILYNNKCQNIPEETLFRHTAVMNTAGCLLLRRFFMLFHPCRQDPDFVQVLDGHVFQGKMSVCQSW